MNVTLLVETAMGDLPDLSVLESLPPKTLLTPQHVAQAGLLSTRHQETLRSRGELRYRKINGRVRYYTGEFVVDLYRVTGGAPDFSAQVAA